MLESMEIARKHDVAFNAQDAQGRAAVEATDFEVIMPGGLVLRGSEEYLGVVNAFWEALPNAEITVDNTVCAGDTVVAEGALTGTHTGPFRSPQGEIPASGNPVRLRYASVKRIQDGRIVSEHLYFDQLEFLQQIGAFPGAGL